MNHEEQGALLKRYEPVLRFTRGEEFFPTHVANYIHECSLWIYQPDQPARRLVPEGELNLEKLAKTRYTGTGAVHYLQFIEPLNLISLASYLVKKTLKKKEPQQVFRAGRGRLARVGYTSRFLDAIFSLSLLARGRVPGDRAVAAALTYQRMRAEKPGYCYNARVIQQAGWTVLQYWFFYAYNNWRSGFFGANDHEADWEMINIYLSQEPGEDDNLRPEWVAYASHEFSGDDIRRRWDDPELEKVGEHPVVYAAAGSHASYFSPGDYLTEMEIPFVRPVVRIFNMVKKLGRRWLRRVIGSETGQQPSTHFNIFRVPFVDYARGDGFSIGPGAEQAWDEPVLINPEPEWVLHYRGLWGYFANDPISGENAPAGMRYNRDGSVRRAWYDPLGWAGLSTVPPSGSLRTIVAERQCDLNSERQTLAHQVVMKEQQLYELGVEFNAMSRLPYMKSASQRQQDAMQDLAEEVDQLHSRLAEIETLLEVLQNYDKELAMGRREPLRCHLERPHMPEREADLRLGRVAEVWAAISIGLVLIGFIALAIFARQYLLLGLAVILSLILVIEAGFRRQLSRLINSIAILLAVVSSLLLVYQFFWYIAVILVTIAGLYMIWENLRELWR